MGRINNAKLNARWYSNTTNAEKLLGFNELEKRIYVDCRSDRLRLKEFGKIPIHKPNSWVESFNFVFVIELFLFVFHVMGGGGGDPMYASTQIVVWKTILLYGLECVEQIVCWIF